jgi:hypothetical protein
MTERLHWRSPQAARTAASSSGTTGGPRSASSVSVPPEPEKTQELMRSHERCNRRSASVSGKCYQVAESGVTEPGSPRISSLPGPACRDRGPLRAGSSWVIGAGPEMVRFLGARAPRPWQVPPTATLPGRNVIEVEVHSHLHLDGRELFSQSVASQRRTGPLGWAGETR